MTTPAANQPGSARPQSSAKGSEISEEERVKLLKELVGLLSKATGSEPNDPSVQRLAGLLASILHNDILPQDASDFINLDAAMEKLLKKLSSTRIETDSKFISFGNANMGDVSIGDITGRDTINITLAKSSYILDIFSTISSNEFSRYSTPKFAVPQHAASWIQTLENEHLLVLHGNERYDEDDLGLYVALRFAQEHPDAQGAPLQVLQWVRSAPVREVAAILTQKQDPAVFVLTQVTRDEHGADFFYKLNQQRHFLVVTSDVSFDRWTLAPAEQKKWVDLTQGQVYSADTLTEKLVADLENRDKHPAWRHFLALTHTAAGVTIGTKLLRDIADELQTPKHCELFVQLLYKEFIRVGGEHTQNVIKPDGISTLIVTIKDDDRGLHIWYNSLTPREQYMVIALTCLNEMRDNQFFAALDKVVMKAWRRLEPSLSYTDYQDLNNLCGTYFKTYDTTSDNFVIKSVEDKQRPRLFELLWKYHRRRVVSALPVLTRIAKDSTRKLADRRESDLFGDDQRRMKLRQTVGETLGDVGAIAYTPVADCLLELAADHNFGCQDIAADAVARWHLRGPKYEKVVHQALSRWLERDSVEKDVEHRNAQSTAVLAVAKILDLLKQQGGVSFPSYLEGLLQQLAKEPNERSRYHFREKIIPALEQRQLQLPFAREFLYTLTFYDDMHDAIAEKLVTVVDEGGEEDVLDLLEGWQRHPRESTVRAAFTYLGATALIVRLSVFLLCSGPVRDAGRFLELTRAGLQSTDALEVRLSVLFGIRFGLSHDPTLFSQVDEVVRIFLPYATVAERDGLARVLAAIYNEQHQQGALPAGSLIEDLIYTWLADLRSVVVQRTALRSIHYIAKGLTVSASDVTFDPPATPPAPGLFAAIKRSYSKFYQLTLAPLFGTLGQRSLRRVVRGLMPEALLQFRKNKGDFDKALTKMYQANHRNSRAIVRALDKAIAFADVQSYMTALALIIPLIAVCAWLAWQYL